MEKNRAGMPEEYEMGPGRGIRIYEDHFVVYAGECRLFSFYVTSRVNLEDRTDTGEKVTFVGTERNEKGDLRAVWQAAGGIWEKKEYILETVDGAFLFRTRIYGSGAPWNIEFFRGPEDVTGSPFSTAGYLVMNCQNLDRERSKFLMDVEGQAMPSLDIKGTLLPLRAAPPSFVFPFWNEWNDDWIGIGVAAKRGEHNFERFIVHAPRVGWKWSGCWFELPLMGYTVIDGVWETPWIWGGFGTDEMEVIREYAEWQYRNLGFRKNVTGKEAPDWWKGPMFCGWGAQVELAARSKVPTGDLANEKTYRGFLAKLKKEGLNPTLIMIDAKWQEQCGTMVPDQAKWPDLRRFVEEQHAEGRRVVLWWKLWDAEGLPEDECVMLDGRKFSVDPTNPKYRKRLKEAIYRLLSPDAGCFDCDGFKLDFMDCFPRQAGAVTYEKGIYGLEMMKRLFDLIYKAAKEAKADALINMSSAHPYFAENCDQFRVHDSDPCVRSPLSITAFRAGFAEAALPGILVDTDGPTGATKEETLRCCVNLPEIGVPDLYVLPEAFDDADWQKVREAWKAYRERMGV